MFNRATSFLRPALALAVFGSTACASTSPPAESAQCPEPTAPAITSLATPVVARTRPSIDGAGVRVTYWVVASNADGLDGFDVPADVGAVLQTAAATGENFKVLDATAIDSMPEMRATSHGPHSNFRQVVFKTGEPVVLDLEIDTALHTGIKSRVSLRPGELTLVGSGAYDHRVRDEALRIGRVFYIVKAEPALSPKTAQLE